MKVYAVKPDANYRFMYPEDKVYRSEHWKFKCKPLIEILPKQFSAYFDKNSNEPKPDIAFIGMLTFAFREEVADALADILEEAGELLPFYVDDELWYCFNALKSADAVDEDKSTFEIVEGPIKMGLKEIVFNTDMLPDGSLFKIPTDNYTTIYCADRRGSDEEVLDNFFCAVAANEFTGIKFEEVYDDGE